MRWILLLHLYLTIKNEVHSDIIANYLVDSLRKYRNYRDISIMNFEISERTAQAAVFIKTIPRTSACHSQKLLAYVKHQSLPIMNPDNSKVSPDFKDIPRAKQESIPLIAGEKMKRFDLNIPQPGHYFLALFMPFEDPRKEEIKPEELKKKCKVAAEVTVLAEKVGIMLQIMEGITYYRQMLLPDGLYLFRFFVPEFVEYASVFFENISFDSTVDKLIARVNSQGFPSEKNQIASLTVGRNDTFGTLSFQTEATKWHFLTLRLQSSKNDGNSNMSFTIKYYYDFLLGNQTWKVFSSDQITQVMPYTEYSLVGRTKDVFTVNYRMQPNLNTSEDDINLKSEEFVIVKFKIKHSDLGGVIQLKASYKASGDTKVIICTHHGAPELPTFPKFCTLANSKLVAPLVLNPASKKGSFYILYPEPGTWYASFRLFCGPQSKCPDTCQKEYKKCLKECEIECYQSLVCKNCFSFCNLAVVKDDCIKCQYSKKCTTSVTLNISSSPCANDCSNHGKCRFVVTDGGTPLASCVCTHNYIGWDCSDGRYATPWDMVVLELVLLVLSNLVFLVTVYMAFRKRYYAEAIVYFAICFFSTFYHACDAGENMINFCMARIEALQAADFYCALLSIWVTMVVVADLPSYWPHLCHVAGAILLSFAIMIKKQAMWTYALPTVLGIVTVSVGWFLKWWKIRGWFVEKRYLYINITIGGLLVILALVIFMFLQTTSNYMYLHSAWHALMAVAIIMFLPSSTTFKKKVPVEEQEGQEGQEGR